MKISAGIAARRLIVLSIKAQTKVPDVVSKSLYYTLESRRWEATRIITFGWNDGNRLKGIFSLVFSAPLEHATALLTCILPPLILSLNLNSFHFFHYPEQFVTFSWCPCNFMLGECYNFKIKEVGLRSINDASNDSQLTKELPISHWSSSFGLSASTEKNECEFGQTSTLPLGRVILTGTHWNFTSDDLPYSTEFRLSLTCEHHLPVETHNDSGVNTDGGDAWEFICWFVEIFRLADPSHVTIHLPPQKKMNN